MTQPLTAARLRELVADPKWSKAQDTRFWTATVSALLDEQEAARASAVAEVARLRRAIVDLDGACEKQSRPVSRDTFLLLDELDNEWLAEQRAALASTPPEEP